MDCHFDGHFHPDCNKQVKEQKQIWDTTKEEKVSGSAKIKIQNTYQNITQ